MRYRRINKLLMAIFLAILICFMCIGCGKKENNASNIQIETINTESEMENMSEEVLNNKRILTIPKNEKEEEELFGITDKSGRWSAPKSSYTNPKTGVIYNEEGIAIGNTHKNTTPHPDGVG